MAVEEQITISAVGGDEAASQISKASQALENTAESSGRLQKRFQERFQHIGLQLFAQDALRASGLGGEARIIISTLNLALSETATVAGISSGGLMLIVAAIGALIGALVKLYEKQGDQLEQTQKAIEVDEKHIKTLRDKIKELDEYAETGNRLNKVQSDYLSALQGVAAEEAKKKNDDLVERIQLLNQVLVKDKEELDNQTQQMGRAQGSVTMWGAAKTNVDKLTEEIKKNTLALREAEVQMNALHKTGTGTFKDMADAAKKFEEANKKAFAETQSATEKEVQQATDAWKKSQKEQENILRHHADEVKKIADQIGGDIGDAFAKSLIDGKNFTEQMQQAFHNMAEQIISDIVRMIIEMAIFNAMSGMGGPVGSLGQVLSKRRGFAVGGDVVVDTPTLFMAGEAGPERATFTPLSGAAAPQQTSSGGSGGVNIATMSVVTTVHGVNDPNIIARDVGRKIVEQIRGMGQVNFTRTS